MQIEEFKSKQSYNGNSAPRLVRLDAINAHLELRHLQLVRYLNPTN